MAFSYLFAGFNLVMEMTFDQNLYINPKFIKSLYGGIEGKITTREVYAVDIKIKLVESEKERLQIYKFRYKIYVEELELNQFDNKQQILRDDLDDHSIISAAYDGELLVGTCRFNMAKDGPIQYEKEAKILELYSKFYPQSISTSSMFMVLPAYRSSTVALQLAKNNYRLGLENDILFDFIFTSKYHLDYYRRLGYKTYTDQFNTTNFTEKYREVWPMVFEVQNLEYIRDINSPFRSMLQEHLSGNNGSLSEYLSFR